jgi:hypothetical protein
MQFTLTGRTIAAFFLGALSSFGLYWVVVMWQWAARAMSDGGMVVLYPSIAFVAAWVFLFKAAFYGDGK